MTRLVDVFAPILPPHLQPPPELTETQPPAGFQLSDAPPPGFAEIPTADSRTFVQRNFSDPFNRGVAGMRQQGAVLGAETGILSPASAAQGIVGGNADKMMYPMQPSDEQGMQQITQAPTYWDAAVAAASNPTAIIHSAVEGVPGMGLALPAGIGGGLAGAAVGNAPGAAVGAFTGFAAPAAAQEYAHSIQQILAEKGIPQTPEAIAAALQDPNMMSEARARAGTRAAITGVAAGLGGVAAGRVAAPIEGAIANKVAPIAGRAVGATGELIAQGGIAAGGEATNQLVESGQITSPGAVVAQGASQLPLAAIEVPAIIKGRHLGERLNARPETKVAVDPVPPKGFEPVVQPEATPNPPEGFVPVAPEAGAGVTVPPEVGPEIPSPATVPEVPQTQGLFKEPTPAPTEQVAAQVGVPDTTPVKTPDGSMSVDTKYQVVDLKDLKSATDDLQPRQRDTRVASSDQINEIASRLDPSRLIDSQESDRGAPIIDENNTILSGNGRVSALELAAQKNPEGFAAYQKAIQDKGFDTTGMQTPVLVRRTEGLTPEQKRDFVVKSNKDSKLAMAPGEQAMVDADLIDHGSLSKLDTNTDSGLGSASNSDFVRSVMAKLPANERAAFMRPDGTLSDVGAKRLEAAVFAKAYGDKDLTNRIIEDEGSKNTSKALTAAAPAWGEMRRVADKSYDVTPDLVAAINAISEMRRNGIKPDAYFGQQDAFSKVSNTTEMLAKAFYNANGTRAAAWADTRDFLRNYAETAIKQADATGDIFGGKPRSPDEILQGMLDARMQKASAAADAKASQGQMTFQKPEASAFSQDTAKAVADLEKLPDPKATWKGLNKLNNVLVERSDKLTGQIEKLEASGKSPDQLATLKAKRDIIDADLKAIDDHTNALEEKHDWPLGGPDAQVKKSADLFGENRVPRGGLSPKFEDVSSSEGQSHYRQAFRDARLDPDLARNLPPVRQIEILSKLLKDKFGINEIADKGNAFDTINQMLDGYRNLEFMAHSLGLPNAAIGLDGKLNLSLERYNGRYLGMFDGSTNTIHMPGRSNSFAHEWAHALDTDLLTRLQTSGSKEYLLSHETRKEGLDPSQNIEGAFVNVINSIFFDKADFASRLMKLQADASGVNKKTGQPTAKAIEAQRQIDEMMGGSSKIRGMDSDYRENARNFQPGSDYWTKPTEMFARAFEAYTADRVERARGTNEFITKGDKAYLDTADRRLRETFPKDDTRLAIFSAFDELMAHVQNEAIFGKDPVAGKPVDTDIVDPRFWLKQVMNLPEKSLPRQVMDELGSLARGAKDFRNTLKDTVAATKHNIGLTDEAQISKRYPWYSRALDTGRYLTYSMRGMMKTIHARASDEAKPFVRKLVDEFATDPGTGRAIKETYEEAVRRATRVDANEIGSAVKALGLPEHMSAKQTDELRGIMLGESHPNAAPAVQKLAGALRGVYDRIYGENRAAGLDMGYVRDAGYINRVTNNHAVFDNPELFRERASELYRHVFDRDILDKAGDVDAAEVLNKTSELGSRSPAIDKARDDLLLAQKALRKEEKTLVPDPAKLDQLRQDVQDRASELSDLVRPEWADGSSQKWHERIQLGDDTDFATRGPTGNFTKERALPPEADRLMEPFYVKDPIAALAIYSRNSARKREMFERFGQQQGGVKDLNQALNENGGKNGLVDGINSNPSKYNVKTSDGRANIIRELTDPKTANRQEMLLREAVRSGMIEEDVRTLRDLSERISGRQNTGVPSQLKRIFNWTSAMGQLSLLPRVMWASVSEPVNTFFHTRDTGLMLKNFAMTMSEVKSGMTSVQERRALAEALGITINPYYEGVISHMQDTGHSDSIALTRLASRFFERTGLVALTNAQRRSSMGVGWLYFKKMADLLADPKVSEKDKSIFRAEFREYGIEDQHLADFTDWVRQKPDMPTVGDLGTKAGDMFGSAVTRFVDHVIAEPHRVDKPATMTNPYLRLMYGLMAFNYRFMRSTHFAQILKGGRDMQLYREGGDSAFVAGLKGYGSSAGTLAGGFAMLTVAQFMTAIVRESMFNGDKWDEQKKKGELVPWLMDLAISRAGILGAFDPINQARTGLRYQRDLTGLTAGPFVGYALNSAQGLLALTAPDPAKVAPKFGTTPKPGTNNAQWNAWKSAYQLVAVPAISAGLSAIPGAGPITNAVLGYGIQKLTSNSASDKFADTLAGEKSSRVQLREREQRRALNGL